MCRSFDPPSHVVILRQEIQKGCLWHQSATQLRRNLMKGPPRLPRYCWAAEQQQQPRLFVEWLMGEKGKFGVDGRRVLTISKLRQWPVRLHGCQAGDEQQTHKNESFGGADSKNHTGPRNCRLRKHQTLTSFQNCRCNPRSFSPSLLLLNRLAVP